MSNSQHHPRRRTVEEIETLVWGFVVGVVTLILAFIVIALLYSVTFVVQPIKSMAPIDMAYTKMLNDIVLLVVGGIGGVMSRKGIQAASTAIANPTPASPTFTPGITTTPAVVPSNSLPVWVNPPLDESWVPPPPPTTPPDLLESDEDREALALARKEVT
jgi:hypothetical protein